MAVGLQSPKTILPVAGVRLAACHSGIRADDSRPDLVLVELDERAEVAAVFTRNRFCAAPVTVAREHLGQHGPIRALLINSGNANAGTGPQGLQAARQTCQALADQMYDVASAQVLPFSTGVIGQSLPVERITSALPGLLAQLDPENWLDAARGIMTTDTLPKGISRQVEIEGQMVTISGIAKGSGMIRPDMATMLAYVATDAQIEASQLKPMLQSAVDISFNSITVDGDTSTNDASVLIATGASGVRVDQAQDEFTKALHHVFTWLAQAIIRDGEGATKFVEIRVDGAASTRDARELAYTVAHSPLVKTALFASDANWGRILAAIGRAPLNDLDIDKIDLYLGETRLLHRGIPDAAYTEEQGQAEMALDEITIRVDLNIGDAAARIWTSDLSHGYVTINAEYRS